MFRRLTFGFLLAAVLAAPAVLSAQVSAPAAPTPEFTPMTVKPELLNREVVATTLERTYPSFLRNSNIGGTTIVWVHLDKTGSVTESRVATSSGQPDLDKASLGVAAVMKFSPGKDGDEIVEPWIQIPITFRIGR